MNTGREAAQRAFMFAALRLSVLFLLVFYGADEEAARSASRWRLYAEWELSIPYWPAAFLVYTSVWVVPFLVLWLVPEAARVRCWEREMAAALVIAGLIFVVLPTELGYAPADAGGWEQLAWLIRTIAGRHNLLPSLHVALTVISLRAVWPSAGRRGHRWLAGWGLMLAASTLVTHQHHVADLLTGALLGWALGTRPS